MHWTDYIWRGLLAWTGIAGLMVLFGLFTTDPVFLTLLVAPGLLVTALSVIAWFASRTRSATPPASSTGHSDDPA